jgi:GNAT superfamily N-acetyltransferase
MTRPATLEDVPALTGLCAELGYPVDPAALGSRLAELLRRPDQLVLVACRADGGVIGWIHGAEQTLIEADRRCEILGLVVSDAHRRQGVGQRLVAEVERWANDRGLCQMSVRSNVVRTESHPFYVRLGYTRAKTQHAYRKRLDADRQRQFP